MKLEKIFYNCSMSLFILLSIITLTISFENIPNWNINENPKDLPNELLNSEIVDYTIDNTTNTILYLINENDNSYFFIEGNKNKNKILNTFKEERIKHFNSQLIIFNNDYYFCSSSKNIIKISNGIASKITNPDCLNSYEDYELKCFYHSKKNVIVVAFVNTPLVNSFNLVENRWIREGQCENFLLKTETKILQAVSYNDDDYDSFGLGLFLEGNANVKSKLAVYKYYDDFSYTLNPKNSLDLDLTFYSKTIFSYGIKDNPNKAYIFTYDSNDSNNYNYYILNLDWNTCINNNGKLLLRMFKEAKIYNAFFIENSPIMVYIIEKTDKTGINSFYLGAVDIENLIVLYNIKINGYKNIFYDKGYLYQNKGFLKYFEPGKKIEICPFISDDDNENICEFFINENEYFVLDSSSGILKNIKRDHCSNKKVLNYCMDDCPVGFAFENEECILCTTYYPGSSYNYATKECTYTPNEMYPHEDNVYYNCADINLKYFDYNCYKSCSEIYGMVSPYKDTECVTCESQKRIYFNNQCVESCNVEGYEYTEMTLNGNFFTFCQKCKDISKFYYSGKCYDRCFENQVNNSDNICNYCHEKNNREIYYQEGKCVSQCDIGYEAIYENGIYFCKNCKNEGKYYQDGKCVSECEKGYEIIYEENASICDNCKKKNKFFAHNNKCEESCEEFSLYYEDNNVCYFCHETELEYYQDGKCVSKCEKGYEIINEDILYCKNCKKHRQFFTHNNKCEDSCENFSLFYEDNNICYFCNETNFNYYQDGKCVKECERGYEITKEDNIYCKSCKEDGKYFTHNNKCEDSCEEFSLYYEDNNVCYFCHETELEYYQDGICVSKCDKGYEIINEDILYCKNCKEHRQFFTHNNKCEDSCENFSLYYEDSNICYFCNETQLEFYQDGKCKSKCEKGYETIYGDDKYCKNCKSAKQYYSHNNKCEEKCEDFSLFQEENHICYFCNETNLTYYQKGVCTAKCDDGYETNEVQDICEFCHDKEPMMYYHKGKCVNSCPKNFGWEIEDNICTNCSEKKLFLKDNRCVTSCGKYISKDFICEPCPNETKYFFEYDCYRECPEFTIPIEEEKYCRICSDSDKYEEGKCVKECSEGYESQKNIVKNIEVNTCFKCGSDNKTWYDGVKCTDKCPNTKYASNDHFCRICFCGFSNSNCDMYTDKCNCINSNETTKFIYGKNCEYLSEIKKNDTKLSIIPISPVISTKKSFFTFNITDDISEKIKDPNYLLSIKWRVFIYDIEINDLKYFATGTNEEIFIINSDLLKSGDDNKISLELNLKDINNLNNTIYLKDEIKISIQSLTQQQFTLIKSIESINFVMDNSFILYINYLLSIDPYKFYYKLLIKDEYNETIPIKNKQELDSLLIKTSLPYSLVLPSFKEFILELKNNREERYNIIQTNQKNQNSDIKYSFEDIIKGNLTDEYNEVESIYLIMKYIDLKKNQNISDNDYELLLNFIEEKLNKTINEKGFFEENEKLKVLNESIRIQINYYEPKTIFSLLNQIFIHQNEKIPNKFINSFINIFKNFINSLIKINPKERLPNSDILSFFRSFDHVLDIYIRKEIDEEKYMIDNNEIIEALKQLSEYLIIETYPGETIRLVGKRISLFLSNFGKYQNILSFPSVYNISAKLNYKNYDTFSFDDYNINQESCDDDGNILLCIKNDNYEIFKRNISYDSNIENYSLAFFSFDSNSNNNIQNINEGNLFEIKIINKNEKNIFNNSDKKFKVVYDIEFPFNYIKNTNAKEFYDSNGVEKNYSNITCIPKNNLNNEELYCLTYFNYETNIIKCSCNVIDKITYISDYALANYYKDIQSKIIFESYNYLNKVNLIGIFSLLLFLLIPNFFYLLYEIKTDDNKIKYKYLEFSEKIKKKYLEVKKLYKSSILSFAFYASLFKFPLLSPLRECDYKSPKYLRHYIITLGLSYGIIIALILFLFFSPFEERQNFIDKRDVKNPQFWISDRSIIMKYIIKGIVFNILGAFISRFFIYFFGVFLSYNNDEFNYWKKVKDMFNYYITYEIKNDILLGAVWRKVKIRMIAYSNICGKFIINGKKKGRKNSILHFDNYLSKVDKINEDFNIPLLPQSELGGEMIEFANDKKKTSKYHAPEIKKDTESNISLGSGIINDSIIIPAVNKNLKRVHNDNFQLFSKKLKLDKSISKNKKLERIKTQYIIRNTTKRSLYENEFENMSDNKSYEWYKDLNISYENNLSYYSSAKSNKNDSYSWKSDIVTNVNPEGYCLLVNLSLILTILLFLLIILIISFVKYFLNIFGLFIIHIWLSSSIIIYIVVYPLLYLIKNILGSFLLFKFYHLKRSLLVKPFYWLFVDKTLVYIFKVRNYVTKYKKEFDY